MANFNDPSTSFSNMKSGLTLRLYSLTYMTKASEEIVLKAFLTDFSDEYTSNWTEDIVYGRMDPLSVFQNTQRVVNVSLAIPSAHPTEAVSNLVKVEKLVRGVYPVYEQVVSTPVLQGAPLWRVKLSNLITSTSGHNNSAKTGGLTCRLGGVTFTPDLEPGMFLFNGKMYPKNIKLSLTCYIFHDHTVGFDSQKRFQTNNGLSFPYAAGPPNPKAAGGVKAEDLGAAAQGVLQTGVAVSQVNTGLAGLAGSAVLSTAAATANLNAAASKADEPPKDKALQKKKDIAEKKRQQEMKKMREASQR